MKTFLAILNDCILLILLAAILTIILLANGVIE